MWKFLQKIISILGVVLLPLLPLVFCFIWYQIDYEERNIFINTEVIGSRITVSSLGDISDLTNAVYEDVKDEFPLQFEKEKEVSEFENFKSKISERFTEEMGIFSSLPFYNVCVVNRNKIYIDGKLDETAAPSMGATAINQEGGYNFYVLRNDKNCKNVSITKFRTSPSRVEYTYPIALAISPEDSLKRLNGESFSVNIATSSVDASETKITISISWWGIILAYFLVLFTWSFIFFQYKKIIVFLFNRQ